MFRGFVTFFWYLFNDRTWEESTLPNSQNTITCYCSPFSQQGMFILTSHVFWISTMQNCDVFSLASKFASSFRRIWILFDYTCHYKRSCGIFCIKAEHGGGPLWWRSLPVPWDHQRSPDEHSGLCNWCGLLYPACTGGKTSLISCCHQNHTPWKFNRAPWKFTIPKGK